MGTLTLLRHLAPLHDAELDEHGEHKLELGQPQTVARQLRPHLRMRPKQARRLQPLLHMVTASTTYGYSLYYIWCTARAASAHAAKAGASWAWLRCGSIAHRP